MFTLPFKFRPGPLNSKTISFPSFWSWARKISPLLVLQLALAGCFNKNVGSDAWVAIGGSSRSPAATGSLTLTGASTALAGYCTPLDVNYVDPVPGTKASRSLSIVLESSGDGSFFDDPGCSIPITSGTSIASGSSTTPVYFKSTAAAVLTLTADAVGLTQGTLSFVVTANIPAAINSSITALPSSGIASDGVATSAVTILLKDLYGNPVAGITPAFGSDGTGNTLAQPAAATDSNGQASGTIASTVAETKNLTLTLPAGLGSVTNTATFVPIGSVTAADSLVAAAPTSVTADGATTSTITVTLRTAALSPVAGKTVTLASSRGATDTISAASGPSDASGNVTFTVTSVTAGNGIFTATDTTDAITVTQTATVTFMAGTPTNAQSTVSSSPASATADGASTSTITVTLRDVNSNVVPGKTVTLASSRGATDTISAASGASDASGVVTFTVTSTTAGAPVFTATDTTDTVTVTQTATVTFNAGVPTAAQSSVAAAPASVVADGATTSTITVTLRDANNNPVSGKTVTLASNRGATDTISAASGASNASGIVTFTVTSSIAGAPVFTATDSTDGVTVTQTATVTFNAGPMTAAQSLASAAPASVAADGATTSTITVTLRDASNNPVAGKTVTLASSRGATDTISAASGASNASGVVTFTVTSSTAGAPVFTATNTTDAIAVTQTATVTFNAGVPTAAQSLVAAAPASVVADGATTSTITVTLKDATNNAVAGKTVTLASSRGATDTISAASGASNASGIVTFTVTSATAGAPVFTATDSTDGVTVTQTATVTFNAGPMTAAQSLASAAPASVAADGATTSTITVTLRDANNNPVSGKTVTLASSRGATDTISAASGASNASGIVTFTVTSSTAGAPVFTATNTTDGIIVTQTATVTFSAGVPTAAQSLVAASPTSVVADGTTTSTITVTLRDAGNNPISGKTVTLTSSRGAPDTISAASGASDASGIVTFTVTSTTAGAPVFTATDTTDGVTVTQTATVTFNAGPMTAAQSLVAAAPASVAADGATTSTITVTLRDANNNSVSGKTVTLASSRGATDTISAASGASNASGIVTFTVTSTTAGAPVFTATNTTDAITVTQTATVTFNAGVPTAAQSLVAAAPASVVADGATTSTITVTLRDANNNPVSGKTVTLASSRGATDTISAASGASDASGIVTFTVTSTTAGSPVFTATDTTDGVTVAQTATVTFNAGAVSAAQSTVSAAPATVIADGVSTSAITVTLKDANGNFVSGKNVSLSSSRGATDTISAPSGSSTGLGVVSFTVTSSTVGAPVLSAVDTTDTINITQTATVTFNAGVPTAAQSLVAAAPASVVADGATTSTITVTLRDVNSNPVSGKTVTLASSRGATDTISAASGASNASGIVTFTVTSSTVGAPVFTATDTTDGVTVTQTATVTFTVGPVSAAQSTVGSAPASVQADGVSTSTITVTLKDATSNAVSGKTVTLVSDRGAPDTISAASGASDASGVVTFTVTSLTSGAPVFTATDTTDTVTVTQTATVTFNPGVPTIGNSTVASSPASVVADGATTSTITVTLRDGVNNPVPGKTVTLASDRGATDTISAASGASDASGVVTFTVTSITQGTPAFTATDTTDGITPTQTATVTFNAAAVSAAQSTVSAAPATVIADGGSTSAITVTLKDVNGNFVSGKNVSLSSSRGATDTISAPSGSSTALGVVSFTVTSFTPGAPVLSAVDTTDTINITQTATVTFTPGPVTAAQSTVIASPITVQADGIATSTITVTLKDSNSNVVSGKTVTLASSRGVTDTISAASGPSDASGVVTFTAKSSTVGSPIFTATDTTDGVTVTQTATVTFTLGLTISDGPTYDFGTHSTTTSYVSHTFTITNNGGTSATAIALVAWTNGQFDVHGGSFPGVGGNCGTSLNAGASCTVVIAYLPTVGTDSDTFALNYNNGSAQTASVGLSGTGTNAGYLVITDNPPNYYTDYGAPADSATYDFGTVGTSVSVDKTFYVTNNGGTNTNTMAGVAMGAPYSFKGGSYPGTGGTCNTGLLVGNTCSVVVSFSPGAVSPYGANLSISYNDGVSASPTTTRPVTGTGTASAVLTIYDHQSEGSPTGPGVNFGAAYDFGTRGVGNPSPEEHTFLVLNTGNAAASALAAGTMTAPFAFKGGSFPGGAAGSPSQRLQDVSYCTATLNVGSACAVTVTFSPGSSGSFTDNVNISYNNGSPQTASRPIKGIGTSYALLAIEPLSNGGSSSSYNFGYVSTTTTRSQVFRVTNVGGVSASSMSDNPMDPRYTYTGASFPGGAGNYTANGYNIPYCTGAALTAGSSCVVSIDFSPPSSMEYLTSLSLTYPDGSGSNVIASLGLSGSGTMNAVVSLSTCPPGGNCGGGGGTPTISWGTVASGVPTYQYVFFTNSSTTATATLTDGGSLNNNFDLSGAFPGGAANSVVNIYGSNYNYCDSDGGNLNPNSTCVVKLRYTGPGNVTNASVFTVNVGSAAVPTLTANLTATSTNLAIVSISSCTNCGGGGGTPSYDYGAIASGINQDQFLFVMNSGGSAATVTDAATLNNSFSFAGGSYPGGTPGDPVTVYGTPHNYCPASGGSLSAGSTCVLQVRYAASGNVSSSTTLTLNLGSATTASTSMNLSASSTTAAIITISDYPGGGGGGGGSFSFGKFGIDVDKVFFVHNSGSVSATLANGGLTGARFAYSNGGTYPGGVGGNPIGTTGYNYCTGTLNAGSTCGISVLFSPSGTSTYNGSFTINLTGASTSSVSKSFSAIATDRARLILYEYDDLFACGESCGPFNFGSQSAPGDYQQTFILTNVGGQLANLSDSLVSGGGASPEGFTYDSGPASGGGSYPGDTSGNCGGTLASNSNCAITINFHPVTGTPYSGSLTINVSDGSGALPSVVRSLSGTGL